MNKLETYLAEREFNVPFNLCLSNVESHFMKDIIHIADEECVQPWDQLPLNYTEPKGHPLLRHEISREYGVSIDADNILCFAGVEEGIDAAVHTILQPSDHAIVITPSYQSLESLPSAICSVIKIKHYIEQNQEAWRKQL